MISHRLRTLTGLLAALLVASGLSALPQLAPPAEAAWSTPEFVRSIGGNGRPGVYPWGVQFNPVSNEVIVGDYLNNQIRRYTPDGRILGSFYRGDATGQPYSLGVDSRNGDIYVPEIADGGPNNKIANYRSDGTFVRTLTLSGIDYQAWITVDDDGQLIQADSHYSNNSSSNPPAVRVWRLSDGSQRRSFSVLPPGTTSSTVPRLYGIDNDASGNIWLTDTFNQKILKYSDTGSFLASYDVDSVFSGDARGMAVDSARNRLYISDAATNELEVFDLQGGHIATLGGGGTGPTKLGAPRQPAVAPDGTIYVAEFGNARVHRYTASLEDAGYFPDPPQPAVAGQLGEPRDVAVDSSTGAVWVADSWNQRFQKFSDSGDFLGTWGNRGASPTYGMNYPRGIAVDDANDRVWVVNQRGHHIKRYTRSGAFVDQLGSAESDSSSPGSFRWPLDVELHAGKAIVSDRVSGRVKILDAVTGAELSQFSRSDNYALAVDPATGNIYVSNTSNRRIYVYDSTGTSQLFYFGSRGSGDGQFERAWDMVISNGVLYVTDDRLSRISAFDLNGNFLGKWGGYGSGAYQFKNPSGIAADEDGLLYVSDAANDRISVFDPSKARGGGNWPPPTLSVASPGDGARLVGAPVRFVGTAADETGVGVVEIAVRNTATGQWFNAGNSTWSTSQSWAVSPWSGDDVRSVSFSWTFIGVEYEGSYEARIRAVDAAGNTSAETVRRFTILSKSVSDTEPPTTYVSSPAAGEQLAATPPPSLAGIATDNVSVAATQVNIRRVGANQWLQSDGTWGAFAWLDATLADPGTVSSGWTYDWARPDNGDYVLQVRSIDVVGNEEAPVTVPFSVGDAPPPDTTAPDGTVAVPVEGGQYPLEELTLRGAGTDNVGVASVRLTLRDQNMNTWLQADGSWGAKAVGHETVLDSPGTTSTGWTFRWTPPAIGSYAIGLTASDAAGNVDPTKPWVRFAVVSTVDTEAPTLTVTAPASGSVAPDGADPAGTATDNTGVARVQVAIRDRTAGRWLRSDGTWGTSFGWIDATLSSPGGRTTSWSHDWAATAGSYGFQVRVLDPAGNATSHPFTSFTVN